MLRAADLLLIGLTAGGLLAAIAEHSDVLFHSDVSLVRVDVQVVDRDRHTITGLDVADFVLREQGRPQQVCNFAREDMPVDLLLLFDASASMRPHVERITSAAHRALQVLGPDDRVATMVFDRTMRLRLPFRNSRPEIEQELEDMLRQESFHGGTDITRALVVAAGYIEVHARRDARRAIVILTDDQTDFEREDAVVFRALEKADVVVSALIAPDNSPVQSGSWRGAGGFLGGIMLGTQSAGTAEIARQSGGDSTLVDDASALETTLARLRQRYALHFHLPPDAQPGQERDIDVQLGEAARRHYPAAELRFRRTYLSPATPTDFSHGAQVSRGFPDR